MMKITKPVPVIIGTGALKTNINDEGLYDFVLKGREQFKEQAASSSAKILPFQANIMTVQSIYMDLKDKPAFSVAGVTIDFAKDYWDFSDQRKDGKGTSSYTFDFAKNRNVELNLSDYAKTILKLFVMYILTESGVHCGSNSDCFNEARSFMGYLSESGISRVDQVELDDIIEFYDSQVNRNYNTKIKSRRHVKRFLVFYSFICGETVYTREMDEWFQNIDTDKTKAIIEERKTPCPPTSFYNKYVQELHSHVYNAELPKFRRGLAGLLYIGTQTGLRGGELAILQADDLEVLRVKHKQVGILHYRTTKSGSARGGVYTYGETNAPENVITVFNYLKELFRDERDMMSVKLLVPNDMNTSRNKRKVITESRLKIYSDNVCIAHAKEWGLINSPEAELFESAWTCSHDRRKYTNVYKESLETCGADPGQVISMVSVRQFRVYVASDYHERGVDDRTIAYILNHDSAEMFGYYQRPKHPVQEDIDFSKEVISEILRDDLVILGPKGEAMKAKIESFISEGNFDIETDLEAVVDRVCMEMPIKEKLGGFCIKSNPKRECRHDANTDEFMCAYGLCPNHCHLYFMAPVTYEKACRIDRLIDYNLQEHEWRNAAEKQASILKAVIVHELVPEITDLRKMVSIHGTEWVINRHPSTATLIAKLDNINEEVDVWKQKIERLKC